MPKKQKEQSDDEILSVKYKEALSVEEPDCSRITRRGRVVKKPTRYEPAERVEDDYSGDDESIDSSDDDLSEDIEDTEGEESESSDDSDADDQGNLKDFVVYSDDEEEEEVPELNN